MPLHEVLYKGYTVHMHMAWHLQIYRPKACGYSTQVLQESLLVVQQICCHVSTYYNNSGSYNNESIIVVGIITSLLHIIK